jgi:cell division septum initiation protein DivIVA
MPDQSSAATEHAILQEITQPLEALPDDPLAVVNAEFPTALRGYERMAVDEYVRTTRRLVAELQATRSPEAAVRRALERVGEQIAGILQRAHETAEQITAQSRSEAEDRLDQARAEGAQIAEAAEQRVRDLDADTDRIWLERQRIVADAEDLAAQLLALAKTAAERFPADAEADAAGGTPPYDDDAGVPMRAAKPSFASDEDDAYFDEEEPEPGRSEIERTVAFQPLEPTEFQPGGGEPPPSDVDSEPPAAEVDSEPPAAEADSEPSAAGASEEPSGADAPAEPGEGSAPDTVPPKGSTSDDSTAVIPPASQAANRRRSQ